MPQQTKTTQKNEIQKHPNNSAKNVKSTNMTTRQQNQHTDTLKNIQTKTQYIKQTQSQTQDTTIKTTKNQTQKDSIMRETRVSICDDKNVIKKNRKK